jgi:capsid protein
LTDFTLAQIKKAIIQSSITMFNKPSKTADATNPFLDISQEGASPLDSLYSVPGSPPSQPLQSRLEDRVRYIPISDAAFGAPGSVGVFGLGAGEELVPMPNTAPAEGFVGFVNSFTTHLAASVGIPAEVLLMKFDQSYSAARGALIMFWRTAQIWRNELVTDFLQPVYEEWLSNEIAQGRIRARGWSNKNMRAAWCLCSWSGVPMPNIDPMKTAKADQLYIEMGAQTLQDVAHNLNGSNAEDNMNRLKREFGKLPEPPWNQKQGTPGPDPLPGSDEELK